MRKIKSNFKTDKERLTFLKAKVDTKEMITIFAGYYKDYQLIVNNEIKKINNEIVSIKRISLTFKGNEKLINYVELTKDESEEITKKFEINNYRIFQKKGEFLNQMKLLYIEELIYGVDYSVENEIFRKENGLN